jgi:calcium-dependent protein kinase
VPPQIDLNQLRVYQSSVKFRKAVLNYIATQCTSDEVSEIINLFISCDKNHDGTLNISEIQAALSQNKVTAKELEGIIQSLDVDGSGSIDLTEFTAALLSQRVYLSHEKLWNAFKRFDLKDNGRITVDELSEVLDKEHLVKDPNYWVDMIREVDQDGDGTIDFDEFREMMQKVNRS